MPPRRRRRPRPTVPDAKKLRQVKVADVRALRLATPPRPREPTMNSRRFIGPPLQLRRCRETTSSQRSPHLFAASQWGRIVGGSRKRRHHSQPGPRLDPTRQFPDVSSCNKIRISECLEAHSISSFARASSKGGTVRPRCLGDPDVNDQLVGCSTGRSAALAPFRILSRKVANPRMRRSTLTP